MRELARSVGFLLEKTDMISVTRSMLCALSIITLALAAACGGSDDDGDDTAVDAGTTPAADAADNGGDDAAAARDCLDPRDGTDSAFRGDRDIGEECDKGALSSECASGLCLNDGSGTGFCTEPCESSDECGDLGCKSFDNHSSGQTFRYCIDEADEWCDVE